MSYAHRLGVLAAALVLATGAVSAQEPELSPEDMQADFFLLTERLQSQHPGLYRYASREELDEVFGAALHELSEPRTPLELYRVLARVVAAVRCGHTGVRLPEEVRRSAYERRGLLPFRVHVDADRVWLAEVGAATGLEPGRELLAVDGISTAAIRASVYASLPADGFTLTGKERRFEDDFARNYALYVQDPDGGSVHTVRVEGVAEPIEVRGLSFGEHARLRPVEEAPPLVVLEILEGDVAFLSVRAFDDPAFGPGYPALLAAAFEEVERARAAELVLDLRGNGGGDDTYGALLVSYFSPESFRYFDSIQVTADYEGEGDVVERDGLRLVTAHSGLAVQQPSQPGFRGRVHVLVDGYTFSTAADVASVLHHLSLAEFVGEETGGGYDGNTSGVTWNFSLPRTGFSARIPLWMYTTANVGHAHRGRGVPVDHPVRPSVTDRLSGRDVELAFVLARIERERRGE